MTAALEPTVTEAVYQSVGKDDLGKPVSFDRSRRCGNCMRTGSAARAADVLTSQFGSWGDITPDSAQGGGRWLCLHCAWCYRDPALRRAITVVTTTPAVKTPTPAELLDLLSGPIPSTMAVVVPITGKRVVAPRAAWGKIASDYGVNNWRPSDSRMLSASIILRTKYDVGEKALAEPSPPWPVLAAVDPSDHQQIRGLWATLAPARASRTALPLIQRLGRGANRA